MKTIPVSLCLACALAPLSVWSQTPPADRQDPGEDHRRRFSDMWKFADKNSDGGLNPDEFMSLPRLRSVPEDRRQQIFERLDKNSNQLIEREEMQQLKPPDRDGENPMRRLWELDVDKSGGIEWEEFTRGEFVQRLPADRQRHLFDRLDTDKNGMITPEDKPKRPDKPEGPPPQKRPNGFGKPLDRPQHRRPHEFDRPVGEPNADAPRASMLPRLDINKDGALDFDEFSKIPFLSQLDEDQMEEKFQALDQNNDLKLSQEELASMDPAKNPSKRPMRPDNKVRPTPVE